VRKYLVATDLSRNAQHAPEWTIIVKQNCPHNQITRVILEEWFWVVLGVAKPPNCKPSHKPHYRVLPSCDKGYKKNKKAKGPLHNRQNYPNSLIPVVQSVQDGVRTTKDETVSSLDGTDCLGAVLDGVDGRRLQTRKIG